ncbi:MAG: 16S rRNA (cytosine(1402)-N(4))-methyltransferase, partial [Tidjanibacter sp.]|nr:16S rRNA (cytosine(1402)-N(4))-methyltransferase [Tidjanibacter sp.]
MQPYHIPALAQECIDGLEIKPSGRYADLTFGGGGHSRLILSALGSEGRLYAFDQDADAKAGIPDDDRLVFIESNFKHLRSQLRLRGVATDPAENGLDGILADLGVSFHHFDTPERGFSFRFSGALDMRMNSRAE